ncbi:MAG: hypothetical protein N2C14_14240, partial [Planctomycetales bacterium]
LGLPEILPADLQAIPGEAIGFWRFHLAPLWKTAGLEAAAKLVTPPGFNGQKKNFLEEIEQQSGVKPTNVEAVSLVFFKPGENSQDAVVVLTKTMKPYDRQRSEQSLFRGNPPEQQQVNGRTVLHKHSTGLLFVSKTLYVTGPTPGVIRYADTDPRQAPSKFLRDLKRLAAKDYHAVAGYETSRAREEIQAMKGFLPGVVHPLLEAQAGWFAVRAGKELQADARLHFGDADRAGAAANAVRVNLVMAKQMLPQAMTPLQKEMVQNPDAPQTFFKLFQQSEKIMDGVALNVSSGDLVGKASIPTDGPTLALAWAEMLNMVSSSSSAMFENIAKDLNGERKKKKLLVVRPKTLASLRQIHKAMEKHQAKHGRMIAPAIRAKDGTPLLSWRVALLPYLGEEKL